MTELMMILRLFQDRTTWGYSQKFWVGVCGWIFVDGLIDNDATVASSKKHTQYKTRVQKPYPI